MKNDKPNPYVCVACIACFPLIYLIGVLVRTMLG